MEKKKNREYPLEDNNNQDNNLREPAIEYGTCREEETEISYNIPEEYLLLRLKQAEKEMREGKGVSHEDVVKRFLG